MMGYLHSFPLQLEVLFKRSLHKLALDLAISHDADPELVAAIRQRWGDHLYVKAEYEGAMAQYLETIGYLEPSYVIRRWGVACCSLVARGVTTCRQQSA